MQTIRMTNIFSQFILLGVIFYFDVNLRNLRKVKNEIDNLF